MKTHFLLILFASTVLAISQNRQQPKLPIDILLNTTMGEDVSAGRVILNPNVVSIELPAYPQKALEKRIAAMFMFWC